MKHMQMTRTPSLLRGIAERWGWEVLLVPIALAACYATAVRSDGLERQTRQDRLTVYRETQEQAFRELLASRQNPAPDAPAKIGTTGGR